MRTQNPLDECESSRTIARQGLGQIVLPCFVGDEEPELARRSDHIPELTHESWLVSHDDDRHLPHIREALTILKTLF